MTQARFQRILSELRFLKKRYARVREYGPEAPEAPVPEGPVPDRSSHEWQEVNPLLLKEQIEDLEAKLRIADVARR